MAKTKGFIHKIQSLFQGSSLCRLSFGLGALFFLVGATAPAAWPLWTKEPTIEEGTYSYTETDLQNYFKTNPYTSNLIQLDGSPFNGFLYKVNDRSEFQAKDWYQYYETLAAHQYRWRWNVPAFLEKENSTNFNDAKKKFFSRLDFNTDTFLHDRPYHYLKEWGGLNHPPLPSLDGQDLSKYSKYYTPMNYEDPQWDGSLYFSPEFQKQIDQISQSELTSGNTFKLLADSHSFDQKLSLIASAKKSIWVSSLVFVSESSTWQIANALIKRAAQGLDVRVIDENTLRHLDPKVISALKDHGLKVVNADDFFKYNTQTIYHTKVLIADGDQVILGGQNMTDADLNSQGTDFKNRDMDVLVTGPLATDVTYSYMEDWNHFVLKKKLFDSNTQLAPFTQADLNQVQVRKLNERKQGLRGEENYANWLGNRQTRMKGLGRYIPQKPYRTPHVITDTYLKYLDGVTRYLAITTPQVLNTYNGTIIHRGLRPLYSPQTSFDKLYKKVKDLIQYKPSVHVDYLTSGVDFGLNEMVPMNVTRIQGYLQKGDYIRANFFQTLIDWGNLRVAPTPYKNILKDYVPFNNADMWIYISFMHSKIFYFDRIAASVGSFNFLNNATDQAYECTVIAQDFNLNDQLDHTMTRDMANSVPMVFHRLSGKRFAKKFDQSHWERH